MDHRFITRRRIVEAFQITRETRADNADWPQWLHNAWNKPVGAVGAIWPSDHPKSAGDDQLSINNGYGSYVIGWDDWVVCARDGTFRLYDPAGFDADFRVYDDHHAAADTEIGHRLDQLAQITLTQSQPGNADANEYMRGMANGLILALATMNGTEPVYLNAPVTAGMGGADPQYARQFAIDMAIRAVTAGGVSMNEGHSKPMIALAGDILNFVENGGIEITQSPAGGGL